MLTPLSAKFLASKIGVFSHNFVRVKLKFNFYWWLVVNQHLRKGLDDFEDLENVSEMVAETSESSKDHQSESATSKTNMCTCTCVTSVNNTCTCTCTSGFCNSWSVQKKRLFSVKNVLLCYKKQWTMSSVLPSNSGCTWIVGRAVR